MLRQYPRIAARLFDGQNLPVATRLRADVVSWVRTKISLRPGRMAVADAARGLRMTPQMMMAGSRKHAITHVYMHAQFHRHGGGNRQLKLMCVSVTLNTRW